MNEEGIIVLRRKDNWLTRKRRRRRRHCGQTGLRNKREWERKKRQTNEKNIVRERAYILL